MMERDSLSNFNRLVKFSYKDKTLYSPNDIQYAFEQKDVGFLYVVKGIIYTMKASKIRISSTNTSLIQYQGFIIIGVTINKISFTSPSVGKLTDDEFNSKFKDVLAVENLLAGDGIERSGLDLRNLLIKHQGVTFIIPTKKFKLYNICK